MSEQSEWWGGRFCKETLSSCVTRRDRVHKCSMLSCCYVCLDILTFFQLSIQIDPKIPKVQYIWATTVTAAAFQTLESMYMQTIRFNHSDQDSWQKQHFSQVWCWVLICVLFQEMTLQHCFCYTWGCHEKRSFVWPIHDFAQVKTVSFW